MVLEVFRIPDRGVKSSVFCSSESSAESSARLEKEKEELRFALDDALRKLQEQHQKDLVELERRLQAFYQAEWDKVHQTYQQEAEKCQGLMQMQVCSYMFMFHYKAGGFSPATVY